MSSTLITVTKLEGQAWYRDNSGNLKTLQVGMQIPVDAQIITAANSAVVLQALDAPPFSIGADQSMVLTQDLVAPPEASEASIAPIDAAKVAALVASIMANDDPLEDLEPTAATMNGDGGEGSSFVRLSSILESTKPLALEYPRFASAAERLDLSQGGTPIDLAPAILGPVAALAHEDSDHITAINMAVYFKDPEEQQLTFSASQLPLGLSIDPITGVISGTLDSSASQGGVGGVHQVIVTATDPAGNSSSLTFQWTVTNPAPEANDDRNSVQENALLNIDAAQGLLSNDVDRDGDDINVIEFRNAAGVIARAGSALAGSNGGTLTVQADGSYQFTQGADFDDLAVGESRVVIFHYTISDGDGGFDTAVLAITITGTNDAPVAKADTAQVKESGYTLAQGQWVPEPGTLTATGNVLANDTDVDRGETSQLRVTALAVGSMSELTGAASSQPGTVLQGIYGSLVINADGTYTYTLSDSSPQVQALRVDELVYDRFTYEIIDPQGAKSWAVLTLEVYGTNDKPVAVNDAGAVTEAGVEPGGNTAFSGTPVAQGNLLSNDQDVDRGEQATLQIVNFNAGATASNAPSLAGQTITTDYGTLKVDANGSYTYTLNNNSPQVNQLAKGAVYEDEFSYTVTDVNGATATATLKITITGTNDKPVIDVSQHSRWDTQVTESDNGVGGDDRASGTLVATDVDSDGATLTWSFVDSGVVQTAAEMQGVFGKIALNPITGEWVYTLDQNSKATQSLLSGQKEEEIFSVRVTDIHGAYEETVIKVLVIGTNDKPIANADRDTLQEAGVEVGGNTPMAGKALAQGNVLDNDTDLDHTQAQLVVTGLRLPNSTELLPADHVIQTMYGTLLMRSDGSYRYVLDNNLAAVNQLARGETVQDVFTYLVRDPQGGVAENTLTFTLTGTNDTPKIDTRSFSSWDTDVLEKAYGQNGKSIATGALVATDVDHNAQLTWKFHDPINAGTASATVTNLTLLQGTYGHIELKQGPGGTWAWEYTLDQSRAATQALTDNDVFYETFHVRVLDEHGAWDDTEIKVKVTGSNDAPVATNDTIYLDEDTTVVTGNLITGDLAGGNKQLSQTGVDHNHGEGNLSVISFRIDGISQEFTPADSPITIPGANGHALGVLHIARDGTYSFVPTANFSGSLPAITYTVQEPIGNGESGLTAQAQLQIHVIPVADAPELAKPKDVQAQEDPAFNTPDTSTVPLGLTVPKVTDATDLNGLAGGDNPERLGVITLRFDGGAFTKDNPGILHLNGSTNIYLTVPGQEIRIIITDGIYSHTQNVLDLSDSSLYRLTQAEFESLSLTPAAHRSENIKVQLQVTSYEVDDSGYMLSDITGAMSSTEMNIDVLAVTDEVTLSWTDDSKNPEIFSVNEDEYFNITDRIKAVFDDLDGSELRWFVIYNGSTEAIQLRIDDVSVWVIAAGASIDVPSSALSKSVSALPKMEIKASSNHYSGELAGLRIELNAKDIDSDSPSANTVTVTDALEFSLSINPVVDILKFDIQAMNEDTSIRLVDLLRVSMADQDGSQSITQFKLAELPQGWTVTKNGNLIAAVSGFYDIMGSAGVSKWNLADLQSELAKYQITPPPQSSLNGKIAVTWTVQDSKYPGANTAPDFVEKSDVVKLTIELNPVAESVGGPNAGNDGDLNNDLTMTDGFDYGNLAGQEDHWFDLNAGFNLQAGWHNPDGSGHPTGGKEKTWALLTPILQTGSGMPGDTAVSAEFRYMNANNEWVVLSFNGTDGVLVPLEYLNSLQFRAPENVSGTFNIKVQAQTIDFDEDTGQASVPQTSGEAWLENINIHPELDGLNTLNLNPASGKEDTQIALKIHPASLDPSETFNVKIDEIPAQAIITYNGMSIQATSTGIPGITVAVNGDGSWSLVIDDFDHTLPLTVLPTPQSNVDFTMKVSVEVIDGTQSSGFNAPRDLEVKLTGVADLVHLTGANLSVTEQATDASGGRISLNDAIKQVQRIDNDGSETLNFRVTGLPPGFTLDGGIPVAGGIGQERAWLVTSEAALRDLHIIAPEHYSGTLEISIIPVTTENDGNWLMSPASKINITVTPSPESKALDHSVVLEGQQQAVVFNISNNFGDYKESLNGIWIKASDITGKDFELFLNGEPLINRSDLLDSDGYYRLLGADIGNVTGRALDVEFAHNVTNTAFQFEIKYEIRNESSDGTVAAESTQTTTTYSLHIQPVTDVVELKNVSLTHAGMPLTNLQSGNSVVLEDIGSFAIGFELNKKDVDGSEKLIQLEVNGVPDGLIIDGVRVNGQVIGAVSFVGKNNWIITLNAADYQSFTGSALHTEVLFRAGELLQSHENLPITIRSITQDQGALNTEASSMTWLLTSNFPGQAPTPNVINMTWAENPSFIGTEDSSFTMSQAFNVSMVVNHPEPNVHYTLKMTLQEGAVVLYKGQTLTPTMISGENGESLAVFVITGYGSQSDIQAMLADVQITPPPNVNDNFGGMTYDATLTAYHEATGSQSQQYLEDQNVSLTPVTDSDGITVSLNKAGTSDVPEEGSAVDIRIQIGNGVDGGSLLGNTLYFKLTESPALQGGSVYDQDGNVLTLVNLNAGNALGLPPGNYYAMELNNTQIAQGAVEEVKLRYEPAPGSQFTSGNIKVEAWVEKKETGDNGAFHVVEGAASAPLKGVNNGFDLELPSVVEGVESSGSQRVKLEITGIGLRDHQDGSESVLLALLKNVPQGFLVYAGSSAADAQVMGNAGSADNGGATWTIPISASGDLPAYIAIQPPAYWSGTVTGIELTVLSGEIGKAPTEDSVEFSLKIDPKVNGFSTPVNPEASIGFEGQLIALNMNINMRDKGAKIPDPLNPGLYQDSSVELARVELQGLGPHAGFFIDGIPLKMDGIGTGFIYDVSTSTYTLYGLSQNDLDNLQILQSANGVHGPISFTAWTYETASPQDLSSPVQGVFNLSIAAPPATNDNANVILFDGVTAINGRGGDDTVILRHSENLDFSAAGTTAKFKNIEVLDLVTSGGDHNVGNISVSAVQAMTDGRNTLMIKADAGDHVSLLSQDNWLLNDAETLTGDFYVYQSGQATLRISKDASVDTDANGSTSMRMLSTTSNAEPMSFDEVIGSNADSKHLALDAGLPQAAKNIPDASTADGWSNGDAGFELQLKLAQQLLNQAKSAQDSSMV
jgi:large repetitive protein